MLTTDLHVIARQVRRLVNDPLVSGSGIRSDLEIIEYMKDGLTEIEQDFSDFPVFSISGTLISPIPDDIDKRLMTLKTAELIMYEDFVAASGDAILIKTGSIALDTSRAAKPLKDAFEALQNRYDKMITNLTMNGKSSGTTSVGSRIDNYIVDSNSTKTGESLI